MADRESHIDSRRLIISRRQCMNCPARLYAKDGETIKLGIGNVCANKIIVLPSYSLVEKGNYISCLQVLKNMVEENKLLEEYYITRDIKCYNVGSYDIHDRCVSQCASLLQSELNRISPKHLFVFGDVDLSYLHNKVLSKFIIHRYYNPYVMIVGTEYLQNKFKEQIQQMTEL